MTGTAQNFGPVVELPAPLRLPALVGLTPKELIAKCDWHIASQSASFERDRELGGLDHYQLSEHPHEALCCLVPAADARRPESDAGIPVGLAKWMLRRSVAEASLPQPKLWRNP